MQRMTTLVVSVLALSALLGGTAVAAENQPPLADAGLDQSVERETSVQLDANGSRDPDGTIEEVEWSIETPDGTTRTPDCQTCVQTTFSPAEIGQYNVTVTVTDDDGASRSDTLHVDVVAAGGPSVSMSAPPAVPVGLQRNLTANATAGDADLRTLAWVVNGTAQNQTRLAGENGTATITHTFNQSGSVSVRAVAYDAAGRRGVANRTVQVADSSGNGGGGSNCPGGSGSYYVDGQNKGCTSAAMKIGDTFVDTDGRDGLHVYVDNELTKIADEDELNSLSEDGYGGVFSKETVDELTDEAEKRKRSASDGDNDGGGDGSNNDECSYCSTDSTASNSNSDGSTRPGSSVPNDLGGDSSSDDDDDDGGYDWSYDDDDSSSSDDDSSSSSDGDDNDGGWFGGGSDGDSSDNGSDDDDGWSLW
ncbi:hypothetical protein EGO51_13590 [Haloarcula hispanica]|uniref:PKD/Chitinase domain-containing protein n=1 Tax=Haloarcula hispanica TaxID=51589 RepID=A0A5J5LMC8_HALHI|nr:PKD domain-containing protein [Haloarcula hispanica]KAA9410786.1 hypothetical protein EGO51_13590 [Haloarcula hispanica]